MAPLTNLLPWRRERRRRRLMFWGSVSLLGMLLAVVLVTGRAWLLALDVRLVELQTESLTIQQQTLREFLLLRQRKLNENREQRERLRVTEALKASVLRWAIVLDALGDRLPESAWLTRFHWQDGNVTLQGSMENARELSRLATALSALPGIFLVRPGALRDEARKGLSFTFILEPDGENRAALP